MIQFFVFGDSVAYGVGAEQAGWADLLKQYLHAKMYGTNGVGEKYELYNFGKPGAGTDFVLDIIAETVKQYGRNNKTVAIVCIGGYDTKAKDTARHFVSTIETYKARTSTLLQTLQSSFDAVIAMPTLIAVDETKVNPKISPFTGGKSFFTNARITQFNETLRELCRGYQVTYIQPDISSEVWEQSYLYTDGLHPNQKGYDKIFATIQPIIAGLLD